MGRDDVRTNLASWEADSDAYQQRNAAQLNRWDRLGWGIWDIPEDEIGALGDVAGLRALELGCGAAQFGIKVAMRGARVTGLDFSAQQLEAARRNVDATRARFLLVRGSAEELPFADASFDLVFCDHGATSFTDPAITVPEAARALRPGGLLVFNMSTPFHLDGLGRHRRAAGPRATRSLLRAGTFRHRRSQGRHGRMAAAVRGVDPALPLGGPDRGRPDRAQAAGGRHDHLRGIRRS